MLYPLDGPSSQGVLSVTTGTVVEAKISTSPLVERKAITIQPRNGDLYVYFGDGTSTPSAANVIAKGLTIYSGAKDTYEASASQNVYLLAVSGTTNVIVVERA